MADKEFWKTKTLRELSVEEWESLCDGCAKCCLHKLQDDETGTVYYTNVACYQLDSKACRCKDYAQRTRLVRECIQLDASAPNFLTTIDSMPTSCAYRLLAEWRDLPGWHPLISGNSSSVHEAGQSVQGKTISEDSVEDYEDHIVDWPLDYP